MIDVRALGHVIFETPDLEAQIAYYTGTLGLHVEHREANRAVLVTQLGREAVVLEKGTTARALGMSLQLAPGANLDDAASTIAKAGLKLALLSEPSPGIGKAISFLDPIGTRIVLHTGMKVAPKREPQAIAPLKVGHVAFFAPSAKEIADFYCKVLGFRVSDWMEDFFVFLRCGPDHHTVNFINGNASRLHHIAFELKDWAHVQNACEHMGRRNVKLLWGPGRHGIGHNIFTYHRNADNQTVECFTELDLMLDEELGYFEPRPWHKDNPQVPKVWNRADAQLTWGLPPSAEYLQGRD